MVMSKSAEHDLAAEIVQHYGRASNDYFKLWPEKEFFFTPSGRGFVSFGVSHNVAYAYSDPVAPEDEMESTIRGFVDYCHAQKWMPIFHQVLPDFLPIYTRMGFHPFKASEEALVDLDTFSTDGHAGKGFRNTLSRMERDGVRIELFEPPVPDGIIQQARVVSDSWLASGRRERKFVLGRFETDYVRNTPMMAALDAEGAMLGFVNIIPSYAPHTATIDMMRHHIDAPNSLMDYLFLKLFAYNKSQGFHYFSMGPAPITHLDPHDQATQEEKIFYELTHVLDSFFSMEGLRNYKAKFATIWEPRYIIHHRITDWPRVLNAFTDLTEMNENKQPLLSRQHRQQARQVTTAIIDEIRNLRAEWKTARGARHANSTSS